MSGLLQPAADRRKWQAEAAAQQSRHAVAGMQHATEHAAIALLRHQKPEGFWCGELTADTTLESDYVLLQLWLHPPRDGQWDPPTRHRIEGACRTILANQLPEGGWNIYPEGPAEINATVKAYTALRLGGVDPASEPMQRAKAAACRLGGLHACNSYTKINLSLFGLYPRNRVPTVPPELVLVPKVLYEMSSWTRTIVVPLSVVQAAGKHRPAPAGVSLEELEVPGTSPPILSRGWWAPVFRHLDRGFKLWERLGVRRLRQAALREAEKWMLDRTRYTEGLGAIYPAMMYFIMALESLGYADDHPDLVEGIRQFDALLIEEGDRFQFQPCLSPLWDTAYAAFALGEAGEADPRALARAADWMISKEVRRRGDWSYKRPNLEPSGWAFEFANEYYPDIDDTAQVLLAFLHAKGSDPEKQARCERRAINWLIQMQSKDGGWAAFDVDNDWQVLNHVPFADHNAMLDPTCPDISGRVLEALCRHGLPRDHPAVQGGIRYLLGAQEDNGSWYGRWGVNYLYGSFLAMRGLRATGDASVTAALESGAQWIRSVQNKDGGWGESCAGYDEDRFVAAESTASQTAWALLGLAAAGDISSHAVEQGVQWLLDRQNEDGTWTEHLATGTGFPRVFYLTYHLYRNYFPILALNACQPGRQRIA